MVEETILLSLAPLIERLEGWHLVAALALFLASWKLPPLLREHLRNRRSELAAIKRKQDEFARDLASHEKGCKEQREKEVAWRAATDAKVSGLEKSVDNNTSMLNKIYQLLAGGGGKKD